MKSNILYFDESQFNFKHNEIKESILVYQKILNELKKLKLIELKDIAELIELSNKGAEFVKEKIADNLEPKMIGQFKMKKSALVESLELPDFNQLDDLCVKARSHQYNLGFCTLTKNSLIIEPEQLEQLKDRFSIKADNAKQLKAANDHKAAAIALSKLNASIKDAFDFQLSGETKLSSLFLIAEDIECNPYLYTRIGKKH